MTVPGSRLMTSHPFSVGTHHGGRPGSDRAEKPSYPPLDCEGVGPNDASDGTVALVSVAVSAGVPVREFPGSEQPLSAPTPLPSAAMLTSVARVRRIRMRPF
jgi:hypothetical protein